MKVLYVTVFVVLADQITKLLVKGFSLPMLGLSVTGMPLGSSIPVLGDFLRITYVENPGMAFGIDLGGKLFFSLFSIIASIGIFIYLYQARKEDFLFRFSLALILGGAVGNFIDRVFYGVLYREGNLFYGRVVDFIDVDFFSINIFGYHLTRFFTFNIADFAVSVGVALLLVFHRTFLHEEEKIEQIEPKSPPMQSPDPG